MNEGSEEKPTKQPTIGVSIRSPEIKGNEWPCQLDLLDRKDEVENLFSILLNAEAPLVLGIDADWGAGKTTFIKLAEVYLNSKDCSSLYLNAWENDFSEDPLLPMMAALDDWMDNENADSLPKKAWEEAKRLAPGIIKAGVVSATKAATSGLVDLDKLADGDVGDMSSGLIDRFKLEQAWLRKFRDLLEEVVEAIPDNQGNLIIFIDELDRCKPTFAIQMLERVKHLFDIDRIVFVIALNRDQLAKSLKGVYGPSFDGERYLKRFVDLDYRLSSPDLEKYIQARFYQPEILERTNRDHNCKKEMERVVDTFTWLANRFNYKLRDVDQLIARFRLILRSVSDGDAFHPQILSALLFLREKNNELFRDVQRDSRRVIDAISFLFGKELSSGGFDRVFVVLAGVMTGRLVEQEYRGWALDYWKNLQEGFGVNSDNHSELIVLGNIAEKEDCWYAKRVMSIICSRIELVEKLNLGA